MVHLLPITYIVRFYGEGKSYENRDEYEGVATVQTEDTVAYISGALGSVSKHRKALFKELKRLGINEVKWVRANGKTVTTTLTKGENDPS